MGRVQAETSACSQTWGGLGWGGAGFSPQSPEVPIWWGLGGQKWRGAVFRMVLGLPFLFQTCLLWGAGGMEPSGEQGEPPAPSSALAQGVRCWPGAGCCQRGCPLRPCHKPSRPWVKSCVFPTLSPCFKPTFLPSYVFSAPMDPPRVQLAPLQHGTESRDGGTEASELVPRDRLSASHRKH